MKRWILFLLAASAVAGLFLFRYLDLGERIRVYFLTPPFGKNWQNEITKQKYLYTGTYDWVFLGDSHMEQCEWQELFSQKKVSNRGIGGETTNALLVRLDAAVKPGTQWVMLQIGINDLLSGRDTADILRDYQTILERLKSKKVKSVCTLPFYTRYRPEVESEQTGMNLRMKEMIEKQGFICLNLNPVFAPDHKMLLKFSSDGVHLNAEGYRIWADSLQALAGKLP